MAVNSINNNLLRLTGLSSGMDTDSIIQTMMNIEKLKIEREMRSRTTVEWQREALNSVSSDLNDFRNKYMSALSPDNMLNSATFNSFDVNVTGEQSSIVTVTAGVGAKAGTIVINDVLNLASGAKAESSKGLSSATGNGRIADSNNTKLKDLKLATPLQFENGKIAFSINGKRFDFSEDDTLQSMINKINSSDAGVNMSYSQLTDKITFETKETGEYKEDGTLNAISIQNIAGNAFGAATTSGDYTTESAFGIQEGSYVNGKDARIKINDTLVTRRTNNFTIDGITYNLNSASKTLGAELKVDIKRDIEPTIDKIKSFVDAYNTLVNKLDNMLSEKKTSKEKSYTPLTEEEKSVMTEKQIEEWEAIAKKGIMYNDSGLRGLLSEMRSALYESVEGVGLSPADVGLQTSWDWTKKGQIELDESKLRAALEKDPDQVASIFTNFASDGVDSSTAFKQNGFLNRISDSLYGYTKNTQPSAMENIDRKANYLDDKIEKLENHMYEQQERYYLKFAALETAMSNLTSQSTWITNMMGGG